MNDVRNLLPDIGGLESRGSREKVVEDHDGDDRGDDGENFADADGHSGRTQIRHARRERGAQNSPSVHRKDREQVEAAHE